MLAEKKCRISPLIRNAYLQPSAVGVAAAACAGCVCVYKGCKVHMQAEQSAAFTLGEQVALHVEVHRRQYRLYCFAISQLQLSQQSCLGSPVGRAPA